MTAQHGDAERLRLMTGAWEKTDEQGVVRSEKTKPIIEIAESCWQLFLHTEAISKHEKTYSY